MSAPLRYSFHCTHCNTSYSVTTDPYPDTIYCPCCIEPFESLEIGDPSEKQKALRA